MNKKTLSIALAILLSTQNVVYAQSTLDGIGEEAIQHAKNKLQQMNVNLKNLDSELAKFESDLANFETTPKAKSTLGMQAGLISILGSATGLLGFALKQPNQAAGFTVIAGIVVQIAATATALFTHGSDYYQSTGSFADLSSGGLFEMIRKLDNHVQALVPLIKSEDADPQKILNLQKASSSLKLALKEMNHNHNDLSVKQFITIVAETASMLISIAFTNSRSLSYSTGLGKGLLAISATVESAGMYFFTRELDRAELLTAIRSTRKDISETINSLKQK